MRLIAAILVLIAIVVSPAEAASSTIYVRDYCTVADGVADNTTCLADAVAAFLAGERNMTAGVLDFGTGHYRNQAKLRIGYANGDPFYGTIKGDGPNLAQISCSNGVGTCVEVDEGFYLDISGLSIGGAGYGAANVGAGGNTDTGLKLGRMTQDLGTCCGTLRNISLAGFGTCLMLGDTATNGSAAEFHIDGLYTQYCDRGAWSYDYNSLSYVVTEFHAIHNQAGWFTDNTKQIAFQGGASTTTQTVFELKSPGSFLIDNFRAEGRPDPSLPIVVLGGSTGERVSIRGSEFEQTSVAAPVSISIPNGDVFLDISSSFLNGSIDMPGGWGAPHVTAWNNAIYAATPFSGFWVGDLCQWGNFSPALAGQEYHLMIAPSSTANCPGGTGAAPQPTSPVPATPTAVPPTATATPRPTNTPLPTSTPTATPTPAPQWVTPNGTSSASAIGSTRPNCCAAANAFASVSTSQYWTPDANTGWVQMRLDAPVTFDGLLLWDAANGSTYAVQGSNDGAVWANLGTITGANTNAWQSEQTTFARATYGYVRVSVTGSAGIYLDNIQLREP